MSNIPQLLLEKASELEEVQHIKTAAIHELVSKGLKEELAEKLVDEALIGYTPDISPSVLQKAAEYIEQLEAHAKIDTKADDRLSKLASMGLTESDIESLRGVPEETLNKLASATQEPWEFGHGSGVPAAGSDPINDFILG